MSDAHRPGTIRPRIPGRSDSGSGTAMGVMLVAIVALGLALTAVLGNILVCQSRARTAADAAALAAASALDEGSDAPCAQAATVASGNKASLSSCLVEGADVRVRAQVDTQVPFAPQAVKEARAGPRDCP
ncbi:Rv3654c family TadE-like protein [Bifidobacterium xylocopae]|uniref:Pilus assembly protein TadE n=1 Tax=Bifidobacterium xylocopae TaxID=2493119 RepID=A0A366KCH6_9BIFI|nr:Rv3654c family TadE-like protein [Bifidobacterium xylocopae]RBP99445.1 pilus assembly protein TadE [Bifidobacterium xylocopae]